MTRQEHLDWCKQRALEYVDGGDLTNAYASMVSDLGKHPETANHAGIQLGMMQTIRGLSKHASRDAEVYRRVQLRREH